ncbi:MarR family transcriptional regulator [Aestuariivita sp.]|jgi:DNA-binding MarR family transcriptional regulator|uniref:MarR family winged helix-turn-helix transcriptional regulator n=1 Tax=Aestuariivita sp. TaxID=1872407 RepID=UPI002173DCF5|nr:MarR family transcriptional regulator [Aestuariivita sp.]MCE8007529.1 MarR family transcriptional regulator [Aestuariivita sp.]|eukprot:TRINITY_DN101909_c0_g1_i1.p2 TRINITY_DN101909_c0_g1~~TRINITY_DN101909_c0_g1_i1.p2  ORF type:complete len:145 (-),score=3.51 TRINITY_DN101909_c0_g1_i1:83-517(-)
MPSSPPSITHHLAYVLAQAHRGVHTRFEKRLKSEGVQVEHWRTLRVLFDRDGLSMGELADRVLMNHPALTKMIDKMVTTGLVHRTLDPQDNRRVNIFLTDKGRQFYERLHPHDEKLQSEFEAALGAKKMQTLRHLLNEVIERAS